MNRTILIVAIIACLLSTFSLVSSQSPVDCSEIELDIGIGTTLYFSQIVNVVNNVQFINQATQFITLSQQVVAPVQITVYVASDHNAQILTTDTVILNIFGVNTTLNYLYNGDTFTNITLNSGTTARNTSFTVIIHQQINSTTCTNVYYFIVSNPAPAKITGDPQFKGLRGQSYQIHGIDGAVYNLISDSVLQVNGRFAFLSGPRPCPIIPSTGKTSSACWTHPGSYINQIGIKFNGVQIYIEAGPSATGFQSVLFDNIQMQVGESNSMITLVSTHEIRLSVGLFSIEIENSDFFVNLNSVGVSRANWPQLNSHGLLGQTWQVKKYSGRVKEIEGEVDDYMVSENSVFGDSFLFNRYNTL